MHNEEDGGMVGKKDHKQIRKISKKKQNTSVIAIQVSGKTRRDWSPTLSQYSRPWNRVPTGKD